MVLVALAIVTWVCSLLAAAYVAAGRAYDSGYADAKDSYTRVHAQKNEADALMRRQTTRHSLYEILKHADSLKCSLEKAIEENDS